MNASGAMDDRPAWRGRSVLVTGAGGFIGSHLAEHLVRLGARVRAMVRYNGRSDIGSLAYVPADVRHEMEIVHSDVTDASAVRRHVSGSDTVFHLAALIAIPYSYSAPGSYVATNISGSLNVLEAVRDLGVRVLVHTSTSETYGTAQYTPIDERHPLQPQSPYSASKIGADAIAESYYRAFGTPVALIRPFNTYGPRQSARAVIPALTSQIVGQRATIAIGDERPIRDLTYVEDTVRGFLAVADSPACLGTVTNLGTGSGISIGDLARLIARLAGREDTVFVRDNARIRPPNSEVFELVADASLAAQRCGWRPQVTLEEGLSRVITDVREHLDRYDIERYAV